MPNQYWFQLKCSYYRWQDSSRLWKAFFRFRRFYNTKRLPFHRQWITRVMRREYGINKETWREND